MENNKIVIEETTLRDGEQTPSVNYFLDEKVNLSHKISDILSEDDSIDVGMPVISLKEFEAIKTISNEIKKNHIIAISRMKESDIDVTYNALKNCKKRKIGLIIPTSPLHIKYKFNFEQKDLLSLAIKSAKYALKYFDDVEVGYEDGSRTNIDFLIELTYNLIETGVRSVTIADTIGYSTPWDIENIFLQIKNNVSNIGKLDFLGIHCHNDMGLALANTITALKNGANKVGASFNGMGERAGNVATEEVLLFFKLKSEIIVNENYLKYDYEKIFDVCNLIAQYSGLKIHKTKPVIGENCFLHESGIHQDGFLKNPDLYQLYDPNLIGFSGKFISLGKHSGKSGLKHKLEELGYDISKIDFDDCFRKFKELADKNKIITDNDIIALVNKINVK